MSVELLYTSAPRGLRQGSRGFCTVLSTAGMPLNLANRLEALSGYRQLFPPQHPQASENPVAYSHLRFSLSGQSLSVLSRVGDYGTDYSGRTNKIAHHVVVDAAEAPAAGPAWLLRHSGVMRSSWDGNCDTPATGPAIPYGDQQPAICHAWQSVTGDAGWGGVVTEALTVRSSKPTWIVYSLAQQSKLLELLDESIALLPASERWQATFSTYAANLSPDIDCRVRCVVEGSEEARLAAARGQVIDLTRKLTRINASSLVIEARTGESAVSETEPSTGSLPLFSPNSDQLETVPQMAIPPDLGPSVRSRSPQLTQRLPPTVPANSEARLQRRFIVAATLLALGTTVVLTVLSLQLISSPVQIGGGVDDNAPPPDKFPDGGPPPLPATPDARTSTPDLPTSNDAPVTDQKEAGSSSLRTSGGVENVESSMEEPQEPILPTDTGGSQDKEGTPEPAQLTSPQSSTREKQEQGSNKDGSPKIAPPSPENTKSDDTTDPPLTDDTVIAKLNIDALAKGRLDATARFSFDGLLGNEQTSWSSKIGESQENQSLQPVNPDSWKRIGDASSTADDWRGIVTGHSAIKAYVNVHTGEVRVRLFAKSEQTGPTVFSRSLNDIASDFAVAHKDADMAGSRLRQELLSHGLLKISVPEVTSATAFVTSYSDFADAASSLIKNIDAEIEEFANQLKLVETDAASDSKKDAKTKADHVRESIERLRSTKPLATEWHNKLAKLGSEIDRAKRGLVIDIGTLKFLRSEVGVLGPRTTPIGDPVKMQVSYRIGEVDKK